jgi:hypothetical protein
MKTIFHETFTYIENLSFLGKCFTIVQLLSINEMQIEIDFSSRGKIMMIKTLFVHMSASDGKFGGEGLQLLLVQEIINIQFFITQSNTDASIIAASERFK